MSGIVLPSVVSSCKVIRDRDAEIRKTLKKSKIPTSSIHLTINDEDIRLNHDVVNDFDWARAAWSLIKVCEEKGQIENLNAILKSNV